MKKDIIKIINYALKKLNFPDTDILLQKPKYEKDADMATNIAFQLSKKLGEDPFSIATKIKEELSSTIKTQKPLDTIRHQYSHFSVCITAIKCHYIKGKIELNGPCDYMWIKPQEIHNFPFPKSSTKLFHTLGV